MPGSNGGLLVNFLISVSQFWVSGSSEIRSQMLQHIQPFAPISVKLQKCNIKDVQFFIL